MIERKMSRQMIAFLTQVLNGDDVSVSCSMFRKCRTLRLIDIDFGRRQRQPELVSIVLASKGEQCLETKKLL